MMKRICITGILLLILAAAGFAQASADYLFFGDNRASLPGLELMNSIFSVNPARAAGSVHNSLSFSTVLYPVDIGSGSNPIGMYYTLSIPNFTVVNITQTTTRYAVDTAFPIITKDLLGLQFAIALQDFVDVDAFKLAGGISLFKLRDIDLSGTGASAESVNFDLGFTASLSGFNLQLIIPNLVVIAQETVNFPDPALNFLFKLGSKIILDVDFELGVSTANNYSLQGEAGIIDFIGAVNFRRYFLSNSLRTGVGLEAFVDLDDDNQIPVIRYHIAVSYAPFNSSFGFNREAFKEQGKSIVKAAELMQQLIQNLAFNFGTTMIVKSTPGNPGFTPVLQLGITKFY